MPVSPDDPRIDHIGFVKLLGDGIELYSKKYELVIGRRSKSTNVDIVLGTTSPQIAGVAFVEKLNCKSEPKFSARDLEQE